MRILVTAASRHGATFEIARQIGDTLTAAGFDVDVRPPKRSKTSRHMMLSSSGVLSMPANGSSKRAA